MRNLIIANSYTTHSLSELPFVNFANDCIVQHLFTTDQHSIFLDVKAAIDTIQNENQKEDVAFIHVFIEINRLFPRQQAEEQLIGYLQLLWKYAEELLSGKKIKIHGWLLDSKTLELCLYQIRDGYFQITTKQILKNSK